VWGNRLPSAVAVPFRGKLGAVSPWSAQRIGAVVGAVLAITWVVWMRTRPKPCLGAVTVEFHPPLADAGSYRVRLGLDDGKVCEFAIALPLLPNAPLKQPGCGMPVALATQVSGTQSSIASLTFAAAPEHFRLWLARDGETQYDSELSPHYAPYATTRAEDRHFCGDRARVLPSCLRGSAECAPFPVNCDPHSCSAGQRCCATPEWGRDFGPHAATECTSARSCFSHFGHLLCQTDSDCPSDMRCDDASFAADFRTSLLGCRPR